MILYVFLTWLVANLLHPLIFLLLYGSMNGEWFHDNYLQFWFLGFIYSLFFSIPLLIAAWIIFWLIRKSDITPVSKFGVWVFFVTALPFVCWIILLMIFTDMETMAEDFKMIIPSAVAGLTAALIRFRSFFKIITQSFLKPTEDVVTHNP